MFGAADVADAVPSMLGRLDQPIADPAFVALRALSDFARREVKVAVGGEGADELFGGYPRYRWLARSARVPAGAASRLPALATGQLGRIPRLERLARVSDALAPGSTFERHLGWVTSRREGPERRALRPTTEAVDAGERRALRPDGRKS